LIGLYEPSDVVIINLLLTRAENRQHVLKCSVIYESERSFCQNVQPERL